MEASKCSSKVQLLAFISFFFAFLATGSCSAQVPLLIWSSDSLPPLASPAAGHITSSDQWTAYLTSTFSSGSHTVLLFLQDKLSKDDFTVFGGVFGNKQDNVFHNLEAALQSASSSVIFQASEWLGSSAILALLQDKLDVSPLHVDPDTLAELSINTSVNNLLVISLPYCTGLHKPCKDILHGNDEIIGKVLSMVKAKNIPYTAIYTGLQPSRVISESSVLNQPAGRSLLQAPVPDVKPPIMFNVSGNPCIMLWAQNLNVSISGTLPWVDLATETPSVTKSRCSSNSSLLVLSYTSGYTLSFYMSQRFYPGSARNWFTLDMVQLQYKDLTGVFLGSRDISAPAEYSYHCSFVSSVEEPLLVPNNSDNKNTSQWMLNFVDFQIQGFGLANGTNFSYASDCAGFFSPGIWMGLVTGLIMLLILVYGLHMITHLNTMDRFDDPNGPLISVPQTE
uniref:ATPase H+ transporting accessory protein 1b n=1 Tax=Monopterus albus TaxID=43700 RepID=A0A3Q3K3E0_MONAL|nr:V-type proton ATPase subunit S1-like [Monopterus albus]